MHFHSPSRVESGKILTKEEAREWRAFHFSQSNPSGKDQENVPALLRRVADTLEEMKIVDVFDIIMHTDVNADGNWHSLTVYYDRRSE
jgi:hypothetical protein